MSSPASQPQHPLGTISEICIVTPSAQTTISGLSRLGVGPFQIFTPTDHEFQDLRLFGKPANYRLKLCFAQVGPLVWEVIEPVPQPGNVENGVSIMETWLQRTAGRPGLQHVAFDMGNLPMEERIGRMREKGFGVAMEGTWLGRRGTCRFVFFDTEEATGACVETIEFSEDWEWPDFEWFPER